MRAILFVLVMVLAGCATHNDSTPDHAADPGRPDESVAPAPARPAATSAGQASAPSAATPPPQVKGCSLVLTDTSPVVGGWFDVACGFGTQDPRSGPWVPGLDGAAGFADFSAATSAVIEARWGNASVTAQMFTLWLTTPSGGTFASAQAPGGPLRVVITGDDLSYVADGGGAWLGVTGATARTSVDISVSLFAGPVPDGYTAF